MARRLTAAQAKAAKQKKLVIVLVVVFVAVAAIQVPRLMKQLHPKAAGMAPPTPGAVAASPTGAAGAAPAAAAPSQLHTFKGLRFKDPFKPLVSVPTAPDSSTPAAPASSTPKPPPTPKQAATGEAPASGTVKFSESKPPPNAAIVKTNGKRQLVYIGDGFPTASPLFRLIALGRQTVRVGVLSGGFSSGVPTIKLVRGKRVTLANEADGSHYVVELIRLATAAPKPAAGATTATPATPAPATTTPAAATTPAATTPTTTTP
jgi:hypothetical protein